MNNTVKRFNLIIIGAGASGMVSAIVSARMGNSVLLLEKLPKIGAKLKASGGGRCNLTNTLPNDEFMSRFGKNGRFMTPALDRLDHRGLISFLADIGVECHAPDGYRVFPTTHDSSTIIDAMVQEMKSLGVEILNNQKVESIISDGTKAIGVDTTIDRFEADNIIVASGGLGYPTLGSTGDGYNIAKSIGHNISKLYPAMMPLSTKDEWVSRCRADTIAKVTMRVDIKKYKKMTAIGDLIFTKNGIRGPVVLDFSREITPLLDKFGEVPISINLTKGMNEEQIRRHFKDKLSQNPHINTIQLLETLLPNPISLVLCELSNTEPNISINKQSGEARDKLISLLVWTPLIIDGHDGFSKAMITRGGISLKEIDPYTMQSKVLKGVYFAGEVIDIDGPCGGYNLQWAFASGYLAGLSLDTV